MGWKDATLWAKIIQAALDIWTGSRTGKQK
jgi:hypothetical protein